MNVLLMLTSQTNKDGI